MNKAETRCQEQRPDVARNVALNVLADHRITGGAVRASRTSPWRAGVLILLNLLMIAHVVQWWLTGRTVSPIEPSETMFTIRDGVINAGFIFFTLAILSTLIMGRFVCGWGCHIVALQDLCAWMLKKMHLRPKPLRSRALGLVPIIAALYMFAWPMVYRIYQSFQHADHDILPGFSNHLMTEDFWATFPSVAIAIPFLFVCGFASVYFLGSKGFCTYACPYGGVFGLSHKVAVGGIRVTDACEGCGHCTAVCTSNVRVHAEVRDYGMVVDPGCMKCMDCVSVCPNDALYFGFGRPAGWTKKRTAGPATVHRNLSTGDEIVLGLAFAAAFFAFRGLYHLIPFLMALGIAGIVAFLILKSLHLIRKPSVTLQSIRLKSNGRLRPAGWAMSALGSIVIALTVHSLLIQYHRFAGERWFARTPSEARAFAGDFSLEQLNDADRRAIQRGYSHFAFCDRWGLVESAETKQRLAWFHLLSDEPTKAVERLKEVVRMRPADAAAHFNLARAFAFQHRHQASLQHYVESLRLDPTLGEAHRALSNASRALIGQGTADEAIAAWRSVVAHNPESIEARLELGSVLAAAGLLDDAVAEWQDILAVEPERAVVHHNLGGALRQLNRLPEALSHLQHALRIDPNEAETEFLCAVTLTQLGRAVEGYAHFQRAVELDPGNAEYRLQLGLTLWELGRRAEAEESIRQAIELDPSLEQRLQGGLNPTGSPARDH